MLNDSSNRAAWVAECQGANGARAETATPRGQNTNARDSRRKTTTDSKKRRRREAESNTEGRPRTQEQNICRAEEAAGKKDGGEVVKRQREATGDGEGVVGGPVTMREKLENRSGDGAFD
jgi:hypothetical protein